MLEKETQTYNNKVPNRVIIHIDMDAFFAAVEERDNPSLVGKPVIVGGKPDSRGVVATCNYLARKYGIHSAMASAKAQKLCPQAIFILPRFEAYRQVSQAVFSIFYNYTDWVEPVSIDEAYLDVTESIQQNRQSPVALAKAIKQNIQATTKLTASAGISYNKFLAKLASDLEKPDGLCVISLQDGHDFVSKLPIEKFHGVGKATTKKMHHHGIRFGKDLQQWSQEKLVKIFGKVGNYYYGVCRGIDERPVKVNRVRKSIGAETTFKYNLKDSQAILRALRKCAKKVAQILVKREVTGKTITVKAKFSDFQQVTRSQTLAQPLSSLHELYEMLPALLDNALMIGKPVRLIGVTISNLCPSTGTKDLIKTHQLDLWS